MTPSRRSVLIVSNGHGEDAVGSLLARRLRAAGVSVTAYPLVGTGASYGETVLLDPRRPPDRALPLPSGVPVILLLPGSRADAMTNVMTLLKVVLQVSATEGGIFACALPPSVQVVDVVRGAAATKRWEVAGEFLVAHLLQDPEEQRWRGEAGKQRMGPPGAVAAIAQAVLEAMGTRTR